MKHLLERKRSEEASAFYKALVALVVPIAIQNFITSAVGSADVLMLGYVGQSALSSVSLANQYQFILSGFFFGIGSGITIMGSQYWGKKDTRAIQAIMGIALKLSLVVCALISLAAFFFPRFLMEIFTDDIELIEIGIGYLRITSVAYFLSGISQVYLSTLRAMERAKLSTIISSTALGLNIVLNAVFIFGLFGAPKLGVIGVAVATSFSRVVELILCLIDFSKGKFFKPDFKIIFGHHKELFSDYLRYSIPALMNDMVWTIAFSSYSIIMGHLNADVVAANSVVTTVRDLCTIICFGMSAGGSVLLGVQIGEGKMEETKRNASRLCKATFVCAIFTGLIVIALRPLVFMCFTLTPRATEYLDFMMWISGYYVLGQAMNTVLIAGIFRAGGDSKFGLICDTINMWAWCVPLGFVSAFVFKFPPMVVYFILCLDEFWKMPVVYKHYKSYKWLKDITRENAV